MPVLGICYGQMTMAAQLGGHVESGHHREFGRAEVEVLRDSPLFAGCWTPGEKHVVWMSHGDRITELPPGFARIGVSQNAPYAAIADERRRYYGLMFHPEVVHTPDGAKLIANFVHGVAGLKRDWTMAAFRAEARAAIRAQVGQGPGDLRPLRRRRFGGRGGADPRGDRRPAHLRVRRPRPDAGGGGGGGGAAVPRPFQHPARPCRGADAFLGALAGVADPETKRKTIGRLFIETFEREAAKIAADGRGPVEFLAQGTLYPDVIESVSFTGGPSVTIKSHHNVGGLPERMNMALVEPLRELFKDEVRELGRELGLPAAFVGRHPFPGPGLAIRIPGEITPEKLDDAAQGRRDLSRRDPRRRPLRPDLAGLRGAAAGAHASA